MEVFRLGLRNYLDVKSVGTLTREEFIKRHGWRGERPQAREVPGLPSPQENYTYSSQQIADELAILEELNDARQARAADDRQIKKVDMREPSRAVYSRSYGQGGFGAGPRQTKREQAAEVAKAVARENLAAAAGDNSINALILKVRNETGVELTGPEAKRFGEYLSVPGMTTEEALTAARLEAQSRPAERRTLKRNPKYESLAARTVQRDNVPRELVESVAASGEVPQSQIDQAMNRLTRGMDRSGYADIDVIETVLESLPPEQRQEVMDTFTPQELLRVVGASEGADIAAMTGAKKRGGTGMIDPYLVPVLMASPTQEYQGAMQVPVVGGVFNKQGIRDPSGRRGVLLDPTTMEVVMLDPRAELPLDVAQSMGLMRQKPLAQSQTGARDEAVGAPTLERNPLTGEVHGFRAADDPSIARTDSVFGSRLDSRTADAELAPMTLGGAVQNIMNRGRTPIKDFTDDMVAVVEVADQRGGSELAYVLRDEAGNPTSMRVYPLKNQPYAPESGVKSYRVGSDYGYRTESLGNPAGYRELTQLLEAATGKRLVVNERASMWDPGVAAVQRKMLEASTDPRNLRGRPDKPLSDVVRLLEGGAAMAPPDVASPLMALDEGGFYSSMAGPELNRLAAERGAIASQSSNIPQAGEIRTSQTSMTNAPLPTDPPIALTDDVRATIPAAALANIEKGMQAPAGSPSRKGAEDFLRRRMARR